MNCRILKAFLPIISKFKRQFGAFTAARDVTHQLQEIKWKAGTTINLIQTIQNAVQKVNEIHITFNIPLFPTINSSKFKNCFLTSIAILFLILFFKHNYIM